LVRFHLGLFQVPGAGPARRRQRDRSGGADAFCPDARSQAGVPA